MVVVMEALMKAFVAMAMGDTICPYTMHGTQL